MRKPLITALVDCLCGSAHLLLPPRFPHPPSRRRPDRDLRHLPAPRSPFSCAPASSPTRTTSRPTTSCSSITAGSPPPSPPALRLWPRRLAGTSRSHPPASIRSKVSSPPAMRKSKSFTIPAARRELVAVTGIAKQGNVADVEFTWQWIPLNEVGAVYLLRRRPLPFHRRLSPV